MYPLGCEAARKSFAEGIARALKKSGDPVVQAYYIRLLQRCGGDESVPVLAEYLGDGQLGDPARCALLAIGTPVARALVPEETSLTIHYDAPVGRIADLYAQVQRKGESAVPQLLKALKNSDRAYRNAALRFIQPYLGEPVYNALVKELKKAKPEVKSDIITYLGLQNAQSALPAILPYIGDADPEVSTAAMWAATRMGAPEAPAAIAAVMSDGQTPDAVREAARDCLLSTKGKVVADLAAAAVQDGLPAGQVDALSILSERRATDKADIVLAATGSNNAEVATACLRRIAKCRGNASARGALSVGRIGRRCTPAAGPAGGDRCLGRGFRGRSGGDGQSADGPQRGRLPVITWCWPQPVHPKRCKLSPTDSNPAMLRPKSRR